ncbi:spermatogenesis-associated protein 20 isoform X2 [Thrips palmi]|nr:spermatogenesis-associated protein 20 isoform X2 [Thrips palmi]
MAGKSSEAPKHSNRLSLERSPYLRQHANNPVQWFPWGDEAIELARREGKLIFLSVGYSTCHWCHVMERESFENENIAKVMNEHYINIKVDREERPDIDKVYMAFVQASCGGGGWPMSVFLTPDLTPVLGGTYYPPEDMHGRPGFKSVLLSVAKSWKDNRQKCNNTGNRIMEILRQTTVLEIPIAAQLITGVPPLEECAPQCYEKLVQIFESRFGGFGHAPKFPQPSIFTFLFYFYSRDPSSVKGKKALDMCLYSLRMMARGGIHDHIGQGFARYSTDTKWHVPHFEKMLYDQGQLAVAYCDAFLATNNNIYADVVRGILSYVERDLSDESGGFYSAEDADSLPTHSSTEKKEGAFYVWTYDEVHDILNTPIEGCPAGSGGKEITNGDIFCFHYNVKPGGNVNPSSDPHGELVNQNVLIMFGSEEQSAQHFLLPKEKIQEILQESREKLFEVRGRRPRPHLDDKMLTSWNALMISGFAKAAQALGDDKYAERAVKAACFVKKHLYDAVSNRLLRSCYRGDNGGVIQTTSPIPGFLDDYAFLVQALLDLYEATFDTNWLEWAVQLQEVQDELFWDEGSAAYFTSPNTDQTVIMRMKEDQDGAEPSGNTVSTWNLLRLSALLEQPAHRERAERLLAIFTSRLTSLPHALPGLAAALMLYHDSHTQVFVTGQKSDPDTEALVATARRRLLPGRVLALADGNLESVLYRKSEVFRRLRPQGGRAAAYVCKHHACSLPVTSPEDLDKLLQPK